MGSVKGLSISVPTRDLTNLTKQAQLALIEETQEILGVLGSGLLAFVQQAYVDKSRGGTGSDGITWEPIQLGTLIARMRRTGHLVALNDKDQKKVAGAKGATKFYKLAKTNSANYEALRQGVRSKSLTIVDGGSARGKDGKRAYKKGTIFGITKDRKTGRISDSLKKRVSPSSGGYQIGVDTGAQLTTLQKGKSGNAGPNMVLETDAVVIGAAMDYSPHFDKSRPIMPENIPAEWIKDLEETLEDHAVKIVETVINTP